MLQESVKERFWRMRPDGIPVLPPVENKAVIFCILEYKRMSDFTDQYLLRAKSTAENQYASLRSALSEVIQRQDWKGVATRSGIFSEDQMTPNVVTPLIRTFKKKDHAQCNPIEASVDLPFQHCHIVNMQREASRQRGLERGLKTCY